MIIAVFDWIKLKFATQLIVIKTSFKSKFHVLLMKNTEKSSKQLKNILFIHDKVFFCINSERFYKIKSHQTGKFD